MPLKRIFIIIFALLSAHGFAAEEQALPEPLSLNDALRYSRSDVPGLQQAMAMQQSAEAEKLSAGSLSLPTINFTGHLRAVDPSYKSTDRDVNDSRAYLTLKQRLFDFGYTDNRQGAAESMQQASQWQLQQAQQQHQLDIMRAFFDVILSDLAFARDNEALSTAFIQADRTRQRSELGQFSDVDVFRTESEYQEVRRKRYASEAYQRIARSRLAVAMGRPQDLVADVVRPDITLPEATADDFEAYWQAVLKNNAELKGLQEQINVARKKAQAARKSYGPVLSAELEAAAYNRVTASTHPLAAGLVLEMPLYTGGAKDAAVAEANAQLLQAEAAHRAAALNLRQQALELWMQRSIVRADVEAFVVAGDYRDLYLDRSRALYELEVKTDLGDAMAQTSAVRYQHAKALFEWAMVDAKLNSMQGKSPMQVQEKSS